jgi:WD40 repeat protein
VKSLKIQDNFLIAGGFDEMLRVYEIEKKLELGSLLESQGSINAIDSTPTHVICGNDQGKVTIWRTKDWSLLHSMKGHKKAVTGLSLHPSQRMALSVGRDNRLYLWNLITGRPAFKHKLKTSVEEVAWSPCGEFFAISSFRNILYYNIHSNIKEEYTELKCDKQLTSICFIKEAKFIACSGKPYFRYSRKYHNLECAKKWSDIIQGPDRTHYQSSSCSLPNINRRGSPAARSSHISRRAECLEHSPSPLSFRNSHQ